MISPDKAYVIGLLVGGGTLTGDAFIIKLPYRKWGLDPNNMNRIAVDILTRISEIFNRAYNLNVTYEIGNNEWRVFPIASHHQDISDLKNDLSELGLAQVGWLLSQADLNIVKEKLHGLNAEKFLTGFFDARCSTKESHRRFSMNAPAVSVEIPASTQNFKLTVQFCSWLTSLGSITDQILYNHPCQHSPSNPYYKQWRKGFKIRFLVRTFIARHSFAIYAKMDDVTRLERLQETESQPPCIERELHRPTSTSIHEDLDSDTLPSEVRNRLFFHYFHFCAVLGCPYAPYEQVRGLSERYKDLVCYFPKFVKGNSDYILRVLENIYNDYFSMNSLQDRRIAVESILSNNEFSMYSGLNQAIAFLFSSSLNGKRHIGPMNNIIAENQTSQMLLSSVSFSEGAPIVLRSLYYDRAVLLSSSYSELNHRMVESYINKYGIYISKS